MMKRNVRYLLMALLALALLLLEWEVSRRVD